MKNKASSLPAPLADRRAALGLSNALRIALLASLAFPAQAELSLHHIEFEPSPSAGVVGYMLHLGLESGVYANSVDIGAPGQDGAPLVYEARLNTDTDLFVAISAYDVRGQESPLSNEFRLAATIPEPPPIPEPEPAPSPAPIPEPSPDPTPDPAPETSTDPAPEAPSKLPAPLSPASLGLTAAPTGMLSLVLSDGSTRPLTLDSLAAEGDLRPARCDLDGDGDSDLALGFGPGSAGNIALLLLEGGAVAGVDTVTAGDAIYHAADGQTHPACGDVDGDGAVEIVVGMGPAADLRLQVFDDWSTGFAPFPVGEDSMLRAPATSRMKHQGATLIPALGDIDGDQREELVIGYQLDRAVQIAILDDAVSLFGPHPSVSTATPIVRVAKVGHPEGNGSGTHPALGDWDGDGLDEIAIGFGVGSGGWISFLDDANAMAYDRYMTRLRIQTGRASWQTSYGDARPHFGNLDGDEADEMVISFGGKGAFELQVFDDLVSEGLNSLRGGQGFVGSTQPTDRWVAAPGL